MISAIITDTHFGARNDSLAFSNFFAKFYKDIFFPYLKEHNISHVVYDTPLREARQEAHRLSLGEGIPEQFKDKNAIGWVVFSRTKPVEWINTLFQMPV